MEKALALVENLRLQYGGVTALNGVSFSLFAGELLALVGPNGSGKTSAVECLAGLRRPTAGRVELLGRDPAQNRRRIYQEVGIQLQQAEYPDKIKVKELCRLFAAFYETPADWRALLEQLGLAEKAGRTVKKLSGGEKQRLSILLALLPRPKLLILDELTTGLDPEVRRGLWESLAAIKRMGASILLVSHYLDEVEYLADRLVYLEKGRKAFEGTQSQFREYAKKRAPAANWKEGLSLEEAYLLLSPKAPALHLEGLM